MTTAIKRRDVDGLADLTSDRSRNHNKMGPLHQFAEPVPRVASTTSWHRRPLIGAFGVLATVKVPAAI